MDVYKELDTTLIDDYLLSDDIWKQFQIEEMQQMQTLPVIDSMTCSLLCQQKNCQVKYDCMWNGHCRGAHGNRSCNSKSVSSEPSAGDVKTPVQQVVQQSLLKPELKVSVDPNTVVPMMLPLHYSIQTPPISDDEESKPIITQILQNLLSENELDDADLSDYFKDENWGFFDDEIEEEEDEKEEEEEEEEEDVKPPLQEQLKKLENEMRAYYAASDHSYHKATHPGLHSSNLGIDTPSDSEEEIDVVSLVDKYPLSKTALPTNPSTKDRRQLQRTMQRRFPPKPTIQSSPRPPPTSRSSSSPRKRLTYKRRHCANSSDSEPEPAEKRHLHNNMERQRRIDLRNLFNDLKKIVPDVSKKPRAAKVAILRGAAQYCRELQQQEVLLARRIEGMRRQQSRYREVLAKLRRDVAAKR